MSAHRGRRSYDADPLDEIADPLAPADVVDVAAVRPLLAAAAADLVELTGRDVLPDVLADALADPLTDPADGWDTADTASNTDDHEGHR